MDWVNMENRDFKEEQVRTAIILGRVTYVICIYGGYGDRLMIIVHI